MSDRVEMFKRIQKIKKDMEQLPQKPTLINKEAVSKLLSEEPDINRVNASFEKLHKDFSIDWQKTQVSESEVNDFINQFNTKEAAIDSIMEPVFLSLIDGFMRGFRCGTKQGMTASRIYRECKSFSYDGNKFVDASVDRLTEHIIEKDNITEFDSRSSYKKGVLERDGEFTQMRDLNKMKTYKEKHFNGESTAIDEYSPDETVFRDNRTAFENDGMTPEGKEMHPQSAETDHILPCTEVCSKLKSNKALKPEDIKDIINDDTNLAVTSKDFNTHKGGNTNDVLIEKNPEEYSEKQQEAMIEKSSDARKVIDTKTNKASLNNICFDRSVQNQLAKDAGLAASHRAIGDAMVFIIKPLYFELNDCMRNGIEKGVHVDGFKIALKKRIGRMQNYITNRLKNIFQGGVLNFFKSFLSMVLEGILNCFVGIFKHIVRAVSEGTRLLFQIIPVLRDSTKNASEKGDAILKFIAASGSALIGIGIESFINSMGLPEPWSVIFASILSAVIIALVMYALDKIDLFNLKSKIRRVRIYEALEIMREETEEGFKNILDPGRKFREISETT